MDEQQSIQFDFLKGETLLIDKPLGWTSFDVVNKIRSMIKYKMKINKIKVGHAGTLDPMATGLLIICTGKTTKKIELFQELEKEYTGTFVLGATTPSFDMETATDREFSVDHLTENLIREATEQFTGNIEQMPPIYSALQIKGERAYNLARDKKEVELKSRMVSIHAFDIIRTNLREVDFRIVCSKGTYIRALARDFGQALGTGAYLNKLRRTRIGKFKVDEALVIEQFEQILDNFLKNKS